MKYKEKITNILDETIQLNETLLTSIERNLVNTSTFHNISLQIKKNLTVIKNHINLESGNYYE